MLEPKVLKLLEMAERRELPDDVRYPIGLEIPSPSLIWDGELTTWGKESLSVHRYDTYYAEHEKPTRDVGKLWGRLRQDMSLIYAQLGELKYKVEKLEGVVSPAHKCLCKQCNKS